MKRFLIFFSLTIVAYSLSAQDTTYTSAAAANGQENRKQIYRDRINNLVKNEEEGTLSFKKQTAFGIMLRTNGYGIFFDIGRRASQRFTTTYGIELSEIKDRKEEKVSAAQNIFSSSFIYGKVNNFYQAKLTYGKEYILGQKGNKNGVAVIGLLRGGFSAGLLKPYYIEIQNPSNGKSQLISYYEQPDLFTDASIIVGPGGLGKGWNQIKFNPGLFIKTGLRFDFGRYNDNIQALEIGISVEGYGKEAQIMAFNDARRLFYQGHVAFVFGGRK